MPISVLIKRKIREFSEHLLDALSFYNNNDYAHALNDFRKAAEAFMKAFILKKWGDDLGHEIIIGKSDTDGNDTGEFKDLQFSALFDLCKLHNLVSITAYNQLRSIKMSNPAAHNPNQPQDYQTVAELCHPQIRALSSDLHNEFAQTENVLLVEAFRGTIDKSFNGINNSPWTEVYEATDHFSNSNRYILISPPKFTGCSKQQLHVLSRIDWSFVLDFDPNSKESGLHIALQDGGARSIVPLTIKQKGQRNLIGNGGVGNTNWFFANGLTSIPDTVTSNSRA